MFYCAEAFHLLKLQKENPQLLTEESRIRHEEKLKATSENVMETMEDLLLWSKSQMQHFTPQLKEINIPCIVQKEINFLQQRIEEKSLSVNNNISSSFIINTDENFVSVIIRNLLQNAIKYSDVSGVISLKNDDKNLFITNQSATANAETLNARLQNKIMDSKD